jgi:hypothetical protein
MKKLLTQTLTVIAGVSTLIFLVGCDRLFPPPERPGETPEQRLEQTNQSFRSTVASAMQEAAKLAGVTITTDNFVAIPLDDGSSVAVNAGIAGVENLTLEQLAKGADVLFTFLRLPRGSALPSGFYTVRIFQTPGTNQWKAQFRNLEGQVALETDAEVGPGDLAQKQKPRLTGGVFIDPINPITGSRIVIDIHWEKGNAQAQVLLGTGGPDPTPLPAAGQKIAQATANFYRAALATVNGSRSNTHKQVIIGSRDDILAVHTVLQDVEKLTLEQLAQGQDVFFGYFRESGSGLPTGFYTIRIAQGVAGQWLARFVDAKGNTVKEVPATVGHGEPPLEGKEVQLTIGIDEGGVGIDVRFDRIIIIISTAEAPTPEQQLEQANKAFRDAVASEMQEAARQAGVKIRTDNFVAIPFDDSGTVVVNAMIEGADRLSIEELAKGADVLFVYSGAKLGSADQRGVPYILVDHGFYVVRVSQNPASGQWIAQFKNLQGRVDLETEAIVEKPDSNAAKMQPICTLGPKGELILFDEHDALKNIVIEISYQRCPSCAGLRFVSQSRTLREAAWQLVKEVAKEPVSIEQVVPVNLGPIPLPDYLFTNCGTIQKPDYCDCVRTERGTLPSGEKYSVWSCHAQSGKWYVFLITY